MVRLHEISLWMTHRDSYLLLHDYISCACINAAGTDNTGTMDSPMVYYMTHTSRLIDRERI